MGDITCTNSSLAVVTMKLSTLLITTLAVTMATAYPHQRPTREEFRLQRLDHFLSMLPEDLRLEIEESVRTAVANGERPQIPDQVRDQIREHMADLKQQHQEKLNRFMSMLPENLQQEVEALLENSAANGEFPKASEELRNKIREHFAAVKDDRRQRLNRFLGLLSEELRVEVEELLRKPLVNGERPHASEELREKIRQHFQGLKGVHMERLDRFMAMLPEDLRLEVGVVLQQALVNGERPRAPEELREKIREHFDQLKEAHRDQLELFLNYLPTELREQVKSELRQVGAIHGQRPRFSDELRNKLREYFDRLLPVELKQQILEQVHQAQEAGVLPTFSDDLRQQLHQFWELIMTPQLH